MERQVKLIADEFSLEGILAIPHEAEGVVVFAHGSGSGRLSPRNQYVSRVLQSAGLATLLVDLLTVDEEVDRSNVFDIEMLAERLSFSATWLKKAPMTKHMKIGYFGASTGAGAAIVSAAQDLGHISAIVSRGGRVDLAHEYLRLVRVPTLLIVGENDDSVAELNRQAFDLLTCPKELAIVPNATHLFEEPGALEEVARLSTEWFMNYLGSPIQNP